MWRTFRSRRILWLVGCGFAILRGDLSDYRTDSGGEAGLAPLAGGRWLLAGFTVFLFLCGFYHISGIDIGFHYRIGAEVWEQKRLLATNTFSYTQPDHVFLLQQWWPVVLFHWIYDAGGAAGLILFKCALTTTLLLLLWRNARFEMGGKSLWPYWLVTAAAMMMRERFFIRPFLFSALLFAVLWGLDRKHGANRRWQWAGLPALMTFWANTQAGVLYGFVALGVFAGAEWIEVFQARRSQGGSAVSWKRLMVRPIGILLSLAGAALTLELTNPNGLNVILMPVTMFSNPFWQSVIDEFQSPTPGTHPGFFVTLLALGILQFTTWEKRDLKLLLCTAAFAVLALRSQRSILFFLIAATPHAGFMLKQADFKGREAWDKLKTAGLPIVWAALFFGALLNDRTFRFGVGFYPAYHPREIYTFLKEETPPQNLFHHMQFGPGIMWWLYPEFRPFVDGRCTAYSIEFWKTEYLKALSGDPEWREIFRKRGVTGALLRLDQGREPPRLARELYEDPDWALVAFNDHCLLFLKRGDLNAELIGTHEFKRLWPGDMAFTGLQPDTLEAAAQEAARALELSPDSLFANTAAAKSFLAVGQFEEAATLYADLVEKPGISDAYRRDFAYALYQLDRLDECVELLRRLEKSREPGMAGFAQYLGHFVALKLGNPDEAVRKLEKALELEPDNPEYLSAREALQEALK